MYDELALGTGHWEWERTVRGFGPAKTPATEGYARQLVFGPSGQLLLRRSQQPIYTTTYQLSMGAFPNCGSSQALPILTFATNEPSLPNSNRKSYQLTQQNGQQQLILAGETVCLDGDSSEFYHWVAD